MVHSKSKSITKQALFFHGITNEPLVVLVGLTAILLVKEFQATTWQISFYTALRPSMALFSFYISSLMMGRKDQLKSQLLLTSFLCRVPFLFFPWISSAWQVIGCIALYLMISISGQSSWIEILKLNLRDKERSRLFSLSSVCAYILGVILAIFFGNLLKHEEGSWKMLFPCSALIGMSSLIWQARIKIDSQVPEASLMSRYGSHHENLQPFFSLKRPWKQAFQLLEKRDDFRRFQIGFAGCGAAVMLIYAVMPHYLVNHLEISYKDIAISIALFKAIGYSLTSSWWVRKMHKWSIYKASSWIFLLVACFPLLLILSTFSKIFIYLAFTLYGIGLAGNHLIWHLSAPFFSQNENSAPYSAVNVLMVGVRGLIAPALAGLLSHIVGISSVLWLALILCLTASIYMYKLDNRYPKRSFIQDDKY
jgi:hypothetical protein